MEAIVGLSELKVGQRVKVKGRHDSSGDFNAMEVKVKPSDDNASVEGKIQAVNPANNTITLLNREFEIGGDAEIKDLLRNSIQLQELKEGDFVKLKGEYSPENGFHVAKVKMQQFTGFEVDELQGFINGVDGENQALDILGFTVKLDKNTEVEGF